MKILLTGASGRIGAAIARRLSGEHTVVGLDRIAAPTTAIVGDVGDAALLRRALDGADAVVHAAALHAPHVGIEPDAEFERINVDATRTLADAAIDAGVRRFVFTSTTALYGAAAAPGEPASWVDEDFVPRPQTIYHRSKLAAEAVLEQRADRLAITVLRMSRCFPEPLPLMAVYRLHRGIDARDVAAAHALALRADHGFARYVISAATPFERGDAGELMRDAPAVLRRRAPRLVEAFAQRGWALPATIDRVYSPALAIRALGWLPRHGVDDVLNPESPPARSP